MIKKVVDGKDGLTYIYTTMKNEGYDPRNLVKEHAALYRESEERRMDWDNYHHWLYCKDAAEKAKKTLKKVLTPERTEDTL